MSIFAFHRTSPVAAVEPSIPPEQELRRLAASSEVPGPGVLQRLAPARTDQQRAVLFSQLRSAVAQVESTDPLTRERGEGSTGLILAELLDESRHGQQWTRRVA